MGKLRRGSEFILGEIEHALDVAGDAGDETVRTSALSKITARTITDFEVSNTSIDEDFAE